MPAIIGTCLCLLVQATPSVAQTQEKEQALSKNALTQLYFADPGKLENKLINYTMVNPQGKISSTTEVLAPKDCVLSLHHSSVSHCDLVLVGPNDKNTYTAYSALLTHVVKEGESLNQIAAIYSNSPNSKADIAQINKIDIENPNISPGDVLQIPIAMNAYHN